MAQITRETEIVIEQTPEKELGLVLKEYVSSSGDLDWEGWTPDQLKTIDEFLTDLAKFADALQGKGWRQFNNQTDKKG
jgi:hypothetical protein